MVQKQRIVHGWPATDTCATFATINRPVLVLLRTIGHASTGRHRSTPAGNTGAQFAKCGEAVSSDSLQKVLGQLLCLLGFHDYHVISGTFGFGSAGNVEKMECRRCGYVVTRQA